MSIKNYLLESLDSLKDKRLPWVNTKKLERIRNKVLAADTGDLRNRKSALHLSASAVVFDQRRCFFVLHPYLKKVLLPAGHVEDKEAPFDCAVREFEEETGRKAILATEATESLIDINLIYIPRNPLKNELSHFHVDLRYHLYFDSEYLTDMGAELPVYNLSKEQAPAEFQKYYVLLKEQ
ncbi:hypothetical protein FC19_GL000598 [Liquorilactobacillus aquaticus DSM 21051]|uniref:Nudix hydrolase domain-containing protein n=1 Tax=Liquorilactobacillus aquaticus DSM 21051 TaxID=1423725 RepID=A0A0R2CXD3_9LACO|nr:hypothetical protein FC19_GL000598 [Liquorilactobacillus aquaticus DSM 21051]